MDLTLPDHNLTDWDDEFSEPLSDSGSTQALLVNQPFAYAWAATLFVMLAAGLLIPIWRGYSVVAWSALGYGAGLVASVLVLIANLTDRRRRIDRNYVFRFNMSPWMRSVRLVAFGVSLAHVVLLAWNLSL